MSKSKIPRRLRLDGGHRWRVYYWPTVETFSAQNALAHAKRGPVRPLWYCERPTREEAEQEARELLAPQFYKGSAGTPVERPPRAQRVWIAEVAQEPMQEFES